MTSLGGIIIISIVLLVVSSLVMIGYGTISEMRGKRRARTQGCGPNGWRYIVYNDTESLTNGKINDLAKSIMDRGHAIIPNNLTVGVEVTELAGGLVEVSFVEVEGEDADD